MDRRFFSSLARRKTVSLDEKSQLDRCLTLLDLTALGVGSTLGLGVYVLAGSVARNDAGPAVCISFLVAAIASAFAGLCYAEFASRVPKAGSAYVYSYVTVGEFVAYIIGWNLILEYVIGTASVARGLSGYIDALTSYSMRKHMTDVTPINVSFLGKYPDFLALGFVLLLTSLLAFGVKESTMLNNVFTCLNLITVAIVIVSGAIKADPANWTIPKDQVPSEAGDGGFAPFGMAGIMAGAAKCFFGFVGFDGIATTGEEAKNPQRNIPLAIVTSLIIIFLAYFGISTVLTMMWPYYLQDPDAPFPHVFEQIGWITIKWIVTVGAIFALCTSLLGAMFPLPRVLYAMAKDGLIFKFLATVHPKTKTPLIATILSGLLAGIMATLFDLDQLIDMMSIGTLLAYTIVAVSVLILRYAPNEDGPQYPSIEMKKHKTVEESSFSFFKLLFNLNGIKQASSTTSLLTNWATSAFCMFAVAFCAIIIFVIDDFLEPYVLTFFVIITLVMITLVVIIARQPVDEINLAFKVPWVPVVPCCSVIMNAYLMLELDYQTWIRFVVWLAVGFLIYFFYGMKNSEEKKLRENNEIAATLPKGSEHDITTNF